MRDLREFLQKLDNADHLTEVNTEVHWNLEASAMSGISNQSVGKALHFKNVKGYQEGFTLAASLFAGPGNLYIEKTKQWERAAIALGLEPNATYQEFIDAINERVNHPILPIEVSYGLCKEVVLTGDDPDLLDFPFPQISQNDGGRYSTLNTLIIKDLESDWVNWSCPRLMVRSSRQLVGEIDPQTSAGKIFKKYVDAGKPMPFCIAIGGAPAVLFASIMNFPAGNSEAQYAGGLNLDPIELVKAETNDLMVPAYAEIIIEGEVIPGQLAMEGPFASHGVYQPSGMQPVFQVNAITHRSNPILPFSAEGMRPSDLQNLLSLLTAAELTRRIRDIRNLPVRWVSLPTEFNLNLCLVSTPVPMHGYVYMLARYILSQSRSLGSLFSKVLVVDENCPVDNLEESLNDLFYRAHPNRKYHIVDNIPVGPNVRYASAEQRSKGIASGIYIDTSWPADWTADDIPRKCNLESSFPKEVIEKVCANWKEVYGFVMDPVVYEIKSF